MMYPPRRAVPVNPRMDTNLASFYSLNLGNECDRHCNVVCPEKSGHGILLTRGSRDEERFAGQNYL